MTRVRSYDYFRASQTTAPKFITPADETLRQLEQDIDSLHVKLFRAPRTKVEVFEKVDEVEVSIMHGSLFRRQRVVENGRFAFHVLASSKRLSDLEP